VDIAAVGVPVPVVISIVVGTADVVESVVVYTSQVLQVIGHASDTPGKSGEVQRCKRPAQYDSSARDGQAAFTAAHTSEQRVRMKSLALQSSSAELAAHTLLYPR
jgi:hypothetical protein